MCLSEFLGVPCDNRNYKDRVGGLAKSQSEEDQEKMSIVSDAVRKATQKAGSRPVAEEHRVIFNAMVDVVNRWLGADTNGVIGLERLRSHVKSGVLQEFGKYTSGFQSCVYGADWAEPCSSISHGFMALIRRSGYFRYTHGKVGQHCGLNSVMSVA